MSQVQRLLGFLRPFRLRLAIAVFLMAVVGACEAITALLIKPIGDNVLKPGASSGISLFKLPWNHHQVYLHDFFPGHIHNVWTVVVLSLITVTIVKGISRYMATVGINFIGQSAVQNLRNQLYAKIVQQSMAFFKRNLHYSSHFHSLITNTTIPPFSSLSLSPSPSPPARPPAPDRPAPSPARARPAPSRPRPCPPARPPLPAPPPRPRPAPAFAPSPSPSLSPPSPSPSPSPSLLPTTHPLPLLHPHHPNHPSPPSPSPTFSPSLLFHFLALSFIFLRNFL